MVNEIKTIDKFYILFFSIDIIYEKKIPLFWDYLDSFIPLYIILIPNKMIMIGTEYDMNFQNPIFNKFLEASKDIAEAISIIMEIFLGHSMFSF